MERSTLVAAVLVAGLVWPSAAATGPLDALDPRDDYAPIESDVLLADDFDDGTIDPARWWTKNMAENDDCGSVSPPNSLKFHGDNGNVRWASTRPRDVLRPGLSPVNVTVDFHLKAGADLLGPKPWPEDICEAPTDKVKLLWKPVTQPPREWRKLGVYDAGDFRGSFQPVHEEIAIAGSAAWWSALDEEWTGEIMFRWIQPSVNSAGPWSNWAIDDVEIRLHSVQGAFPTVEKDHLFGRTVCLDEDGDDRCEEEEHDLSPAVDCSNSSRVVGDPDCGSYSAYDDEDRDHRRDDDEWTIATTPGARLGPWSNCSHWPNVRVYRDRNASGDQDPDEPTLVRACGEEGWPTLSALGHPLLTGPPERPGG